jgi:3-methylcrotonyl-CoA carboxylase alpha subunit
MLCNPVADRRSTSAILSAVEIIAGQEVLVIEAMKMELGLKAPRDGVIAEVRAAAGDFVEADAVLVTLDP